MVDYSIPVIQKKMDETALRHMGTTLVMLAMLPNISILRCDRTEVSVRSMGEKALVLYNFTGMAAYMGAFYKVMSAIHAEELQIIQGLKPKDEFIVANAMKAYLFESGYDFSFAAACAENNAWLVLAYADIIVADHEGDPARIKEVIERQLGAYRRKFQPELK